MIFYLFMHIFFLPLYFIASCHITFNNIKRNTLYWKMTHSVTSGISKEFQKFIMISLWFLTQGLNLLPSLPCIRPYRIFSFDCRAYFLIRTFHRIFNVQARPTDLLSSIYSFNSYSLSAHILINGIAESDSYKFMVNNIRPWIK